MVILRSSILYCTTSASFFFLFHSYSPFTVRISYNVFVHTFALPSFNGKICSRIAVNLSFTEEMKGWLWSYRNLTHWYRYFNVITKLFQLFLSLSLLTFISCFLNSFSFFAHFFHSMPGSTVVRWMNNKKIAILRSSMSFWVEKKVSVNFFLSVLSGKWGLNVWTKWNGNWFLTIGKFFYLQIHTWVE